MKKWSILILLLLLVACNDAEPDQKKNDKVDDSIIVEEAENSTEVVESIVEDKNIVPQDVFEKTSFRNEALNYYDIRASLDVDKDIITATQKVEYTNVEGLDLEAIYFHVYPNAFKKGNHPSLFDKDLDEIDHQYGFVDVKEIHINGEGVSFELAPIDTTLKIAYLFEANKSYTIELTYDVYISTTSERFGVAGGIYNLGNWYPILAAYDEEGWHLDPYYSVGDPFYSDMSNYDVQMTVPNDYEVAASGYLNAYEMAEQQTFNFRGDAMRDFAFVIGNEFTIESHEIDGTTVYLYYPPSIKDHKWLDEALYFGYSTIELYDDLIGDYPYKNYSVVITNFPSGMEYPGLVFISDGYFNGYSVDNLRGVIVHETVHQWFYSLIGDDEIEDGWIDEGLTSYFTAYYDWVFDKKDAYNETIKSYKKRVKSTGLENIDVTKSAEFIYDWGEYGLTAYATPAVMYDELMSTYGEKKLIEFAQLLYDRFAFGILKEDGLKSALIDVYGEEVMEIVDTYLK